MDEKELEKRFLFHPAKEDQKPRYEKLRANFLELAKLLVATCPESRELSVAVTNLEQAQFWANASIARNE